MNRFITTALVAVVSAFLVLAALAVPIVIADSVIKALFDMP
jgi:hypothetical protein